MFNSRMHLRQVAAGAALLLASAGALAAEAGRVVFVSGDVQLGRRAVALNDAVQEGDEISTGKSGYVYVKTVDDGLLVLRPSSRARIEAYHIDRQNPANTRVKLELLEGVARSVSGSGVKAARQNFRFNTPVAAIGVRGTDFTVFTDQETSNVTVLSGAIVVSGFGGSCQPGGAGPCEHQASRELSAAQAGQVLQVRRGRAEPNLLQGGAVSPDAAAPPRSDEPGKSSGTSTSSTEPSLDPQKASTVLQLALNNVKQTVQPPVTAPADQPVVQEVPPSQLVWGRWASLAGQPGTLKGSEIVAAGGKVVATNSYYSIYRTQGSDVLLPQSGSAAFALNQSEALVSDSATKLVTAAALSNGQLNVDFGARTFTTGFDLTTGKDTFRLNAAGNMSENGAISAINQFLPSSNMNVSGALGAQNDAAYIFSARLDARRTANGVTYWVK
ncbi:FecR family protein [[Empedobacter] haloabium]|uniref:FecR family protein n=1 Tax=[Empedobacter] haloabium TaxID=592317 RepID=A0ABZ1UIH5_9BURK